MTKKDIQAKVEFEKLKAKLIENGFVFNCDTDAKFAKLNVGDKYVIESKNNSYKFPQGTIKTVEQDDTQTIYFAQHPEERKVSFVRDDSCKSSENSLAYIL